MPQTDKAHVYMRDGKQYVIIPDEFRFRTTQVKVRRDPETGAVVLTEIPSLEEVFAALDATASPDDFMKDRDQGTPEDREPL